MRWLWHHRKISLTRSFLFLYECWRNLACWGRCVNNAALIISIHLTSPFHLPGPETIFLPSSWLFLVSANGRELTIPASLGLASFPYWYGPLAPTILLQMTESCSVCSSLLVNRLHCCSSTDDRHVGQFHVLAIASSTTASMSVWGSCQYANMLFIFWCCDETPWPRQLQDE